ncbi:MAG: endo-1,4-beta-xylanase, partial [Ignavibacteriaceae bacterium]
EGWYIEINASISPAPVFEVVTEEAQEGEQALKVTINAVGTQAWDIQLVGDSIPVQPGETYSYSIWAKASAPAQANFTVGNYAFNEYGTPIRPSAPNITTEWQEFTMEFTVTDNQTVIRAPIHFNIAVNAGVSIFIDNFKMAKVVDPNDLNRPVIVEAEDGILGSDFSVLEDGDISYIAIQSDLITSGSPGSTARVATYQVTFPDTGEYDLFARVRVGANTFNDDSYFYGNGFGLKDSATDTDWIIANGFSNGGYAETNDVVYEPGGLGAGVWKWINFSKNPYQMPTSITYTVNEEELTQTFQIGGREDGLDIDKFAFGKSNLYYTVGNLTNGEPGSVDIPEPAWEGPPLSSGQPKWVGSAHSSLQEPGFELYWNQVTPENGGKWGSVEGSRDNMNWGAAQAAYDFALENGFPIRWHVLLWGNQFPLWIENLSGDEQIEEIREWFQAVADRFPDLDYVEVVNEPINDPPTAGNGNYYNALGGAGTTGWDWILTAFRMAREIFPDSVKLMINEYGILSSSSTASEYLEIIRLLQAENLVDVIGVQGHAFTTIAPATLMRRVLDSLATTGLPIQVTEMDIDGPSDAIQLQNYQRIFPPLYSHPAVEGITLWGWKPGLWRNNEAAYIINSDGTERPALQWLREYLDTVVLPVVSVDDIAGVPESYQLHNNYPNPFNPTTTISFSLPERSDVSLVLVDVLGKEVMNIASGSYNVGTYSIQLNASGLSSGVYFYRLQAGNFVSVKKLMLMK